MDKKSVKNPNIIQPIIRILYKIVPYIPSFINTYNLTLISILWSSLNLYAGYKSKKNIKWLYLNILCIILHTITDNLDGKVGKYRNTGAIKWGYFMDHSMDFTFSNSLIFSLILCLPKIRLYLIVILILINQAFSISFLSLDNDGMDISYCLKNICIGPADSLILFAILIFYIIKSNGNINTNFLIITCCVLFILNSYKIYNKQIKFHNEDMKLKNESK